VSLWGVASDAVRVGLAAGVETCLVGLVLINVTFRSFLLNVVEERKTEAEIADEIEARGRLGCQGFQVPSYCRRRCTCVEQEPGQQSIQGYSIAVRGVKSIHTIRGYWTRRRAGNSAVMLQNECQATHLATSNNRGSDLLSLVRQGSSSGMRAGEIQVDQ
jgi:hypothetical protein